MRVKQFSGLELHFASAKVSRLVCNLNEKGGGSDEEDRCIDGAHDFHSYVGIVFAEEAAKPAAPEQKAVTKAPAKKKKIAKKKKEEKKTETAQAAAPAPAAPKAAAAAGGYK